MDDEPESTNRDSSTRSLTRLKNWILLDGPRSAVIGITASGLLLFLTAVSFSPFSPLSSYQSIFYAFGGLISGNFTLITVVVSINQLLLSQKLQTPDELRSQIEGVIDYREEIEDASERIAPVEPSEFLRLLIENTRQTAQQLGGLSITEASSETSDELNEIITNVTREIDRTDDLLEESTLSTFHVLVTTLNTNYAKDIHRLRQIRYRQNDQLPSHVDDSIRKLIDQLQYIDVARQYFKTIYLQQELASLSRLLFYTGLPSLAILVTTLFLLTVPVGATIPTPLTEILLPTTLTIGFLPLVVLFSFILRSATVTRRTAATFPFTTSMQEKR